MKLKPIFLILALLFAFLGSFVLAAAPLDVVISEIAWMGTKISANDEWIELFNNTDKDINLKGWGIYEAGGKTLIEPLTGVIKAGSYYLIERTDETTVPNLPASQEPSSWGGYGLKNKGEYLQLKDSKGQVIDEVNCSKGWFAGDSKSKQTMERKNLLSPGNKKENWQTSQAPGGTPKTKNSKGKSSKKKLIAADLFPAPLDNNQELSLMPVNFWLILTIGLFVALLAGALMLFIKKKIEKKKNLS